MKIILPENVSFIIDRITSAGYEAYAVGGCVRDSILGRTPDDWDITTSAKASEVKALFPRTIDTGIQHGTVTVMMGKEGYEVTTYRIDGIYTDSRHPDSVSFTDNLYEDLRRRDFTINAMAYNYEKGLIDPFDGIRDIERTLIRCVGKPEERFGEDALRILRAFRFAAQLGFRIDSDTCSAAGLLAATLSKISAERIHTELGKLLLSPNPDMIIRLCRTGVANFILPELSILPESDLELLAKRLCACPDTPGCLRWALLLYTTGNCREILKRLKSDNNTLRTVSTLADNAERQLSSLSDTELRRVIRDIGKPNTELLFELQKILYENTDFTDAYKRYLAICSAGDCTSIRELGISGSDLLNVGIPQGTGIGVMLNRLLDAVIEQPSLNKRETLLSLAAYYRSKDK